MLKGYLVVALVTLLLSGCSSSTVVATDEGGPAQQLVVGKFFLGVDVASARVTAETQDGATLAEAVTDATGNFYLRGAFPAEFRIAGTVPGSSLRFASEVRAGRRFVVINVPNALVSHYLAARPGTTLAEGEAWVRSVLKFPANTELGWVEDGPRAAFSHIDFFAKAAAGGGWSAYTAQLLTSGKATGPHRLERRDLTAPLAGLEMELRDLIEAARSDPGLVAGVQASVKHFTLARSKEGGVTAAGFGEFLLTNVGGSLATDAGNDLVGWLTSSLGWNMGTGAALAQIQAELTQLINDLDVLALQGATMNASDALSGYVSATNTLVVAQGSAVNSLTNNGTANLTNLPTSGSSAVSALLGTLSAYQATTSLQQFSTFMLGRNGATNLITTNLKLVLGQSYGIQPSESTGEPFPVRSSLLLDQTLLTFNYYAGQQSLAANFLAEQSHPAFPLQAPAITINTNQVVVAGAAYDLALQRQQLPPYPASDNVLIDLQYGLMWYLDVQAATTLDQAQYAAENFQLTGSGVTYTGWSLPTVEQLVALQNRGRYVAVALRDPDVAHDGSNSSYGNFGYVLQGLSAGSTGTGGLGFTSADLINSDGYVWFSNPNYGFFGLNHEHANQYSGGKDTQMPYIMVRDLTQAELSPGEYPATGNPSAINGLSLTANSVSINLSTQTGGANNNTLTSRQDFVTPLVTYTATFGGDFTAGASNQTKEKSPLVTTNQALTLGGSQGSFDQLQSPVAFGVSGNATISNYADLQGIVTWQAPGPQTANVTASLLGLSGLLTFAGPVTQAAPPPRTLRTILISPRNFLFTNGNLTANQGLQYYCTGYYSDLTVADLTGNVTWNIVNKQSGNPIPGAFFSGSALAFNNQALPATMAEALATVSATYAGVTDSTNAQLGQPPNQ